MAIEITVESYAHPGSHDPSIITQDASNRFVTDIQIAAWDAVVGDSQPAADAAAASAAAALASEQAAALSETAAGDSEIAAGLSESAAALSEGNAAGSEASVAANASAASASEINANQSAINAAISEGNAETFKDQAEAAAVAAGAASFTTGDVKITLKNSADAGWVMADDGTIGSAASGASNRANADCEELYELLWNNIPNTYAPVTGGRGASAQADFDADKPIQIGRFLGRTLAVAGAGEGLTARVLGEILGTETHTLVDGEMPAHDHGGATSSDGNHTHSLGVGDPNEPGSSFHKSTLSLSSASTSSNGAHTHTIASEGGDGAHNNMQPTAFVNIFIKL